MRRPAIPIFGFPRAYDAVLRYGTSTISIGVALAIALLLRHYHLPHPFISFSFAAIAIISGMGERDQACSLSHSPTSRGAISRFPPRPAMRIQNPGWLCTGCSAFSWAGSVRHVAARNDCSPEHATVWRFELFSAQQNLQW